MVTPHAARGAGHESNSVVKQTHDHLRFAHSVDVLSTGPQPFAAATPSSGWTPTLAARACRRCKNRVDSYRPHSKTAPARRHPGDSGRFVAVLTTDRNRTGSFASGD